MSVNLSFIGGAGWQFFDNNGDILSGGKIYTYAAGTTTPLTTYTSRTGLTANTNPIVLDAYGRTPEQVWSTEGLLYKYVVALSNDVVVRTWDNIGGSVVASDLAASLAASSGSSLVGFLSAGTGAVATTVQTKLRESVSVKDFGAVGDGITDDSVAIQLAATAATGKTLYFPSGTYIGTNISLPANIFVTGNATLKLKVQASLTFQPFFRLTGANVKFDVLIFDGNKALQPANGFSDSWDTGANGTGKSNRSMIYGDNYNTGYSISNILVTTCEFRNVYGASIALRDVSNVLVDGNYFYDSNFEGCFFYQQVGGNQDARIVNNKFYNLSSGDATVNANCIVCSGYNEVIIANNWANTFERNLVKLEGCNNAIVDANQISNNTLNNFNCLQVAAGGTNIVISNNVIKNVKYGILIETGTIENINISNNIFDTVGSASSVRDAIAVISATNVNVTGNVIKNSYRYGVQVTNCVNVVLSENAVSNATNANYESYKIGSCTGSIIFLGNTSNGKQSSNDGILNISGSSTISALSIIGNTLNGTSAANNRGIFGSGSTVTGGNISNNVTTGTIELNFVAGSIVNVFSNNCTRVAAPAGAFARMIGFGSSAPISGTHYVGDVLLHSAPAASGNIGFVCTTGGTPGTWKTFGAISA